jgi:hypothetical protein
LRESSQRDEGSSRSMNVGRNGANVCGRTEDKSSIHETDGRVVKRQVRSIACNILEDRP